ncbi:MAG: hypothetical protein PHF37_04615 [Phycisphaerae bacterium]|nr:hypothetical protein [Phycisphaerae bacterium]
MRYTILIFVCILSAIQCKGANPENRLRDINETVSQQRQDIESWYAFWVGQMRRSAEQRAGRLKFSERQIWTEFIRMTAQTPLADTYLLDTARSFQDNREAFELRTAIMDNFFIDTAANFLMNADAQALLSYIVNNDIYIADGEDRDFLLRTEAKKILLIMDEFVPQLTRLENLRSLKLADLRQWEMESKEGISEVTQRIETQPKSPQYGVVSAISYGPMDVSCMVEGVDEIIKPQDTIKNSMIKDVKVAKIDRYKVEFEKDGKRWAQAVGQAAKPMWKIRDQKQN